MKTCPDCKETKPTSEFGNSKVRKDGLSFYCRECVRRQSAEKRQRIRDDEERNQAYLAKRAEEMRERRAKNPEAYQYSNIRTPEEHRAYRLLNRYGLTEERCQEILESQEGLCRICSVDISENFVVDHDHSCCSGSRKTCGQCVRGFLCQQCNKRLGFIEGDAEWLIAALAYIRMEIQ